MKYLLMIYENEVEGVAKDAERAACRAESAALLLQMRAAGQLVLAQPLEPASRASTVRVRNGRATVTDGPFAETPEQLAGVFLVDVADLDEALGLAAQVPCSAHGSVEVRPLAELA